MQAAVDTGGAERFDGIVERDVDCVDVEVGRVVEHPGKVGGVDEVPAVLRWCRALAVDAAHGRRVVGQRGDLLEAQGEAPVVPVVVDVVQGVAGLVHRLVEAYLVGRAALVLAFGDVERTQEQFAGEFERSATEREPVQVTVEPRIRRLDGAVHDVEGQVGPELEATPDGRVASSRSMRMRMRNSTGSGRGFFAATDAEVAARTRGGMAMVGSVPNRR